MKGFGTHIATHPRLVAAAAVGVAAAWWVPGSHSPVTRALIGWNIGVWLYLASIGVMMWRADRGHLQRVAQRQAEGAVAVLTVVITAAVVSIGAIVLELASAKGGGGGLALPRLLLVLFTVAGSWTLVPTLFGLNYASLYYAGKSAKGLRFPAEEEDFEPDYADFLYYSFTIAVAAQTADVAISTREMRRLTLLQSILAFVFNTTVLAFSINIAASLF